MREPANPQKKIPSHGIMQKFAYLLSAYWVREGLQAVFVISLPRHSSTTYGEFMLALSVGQILLFVAEFGLNQHLVSLLIRRTNDPGDVLAQVSVLKGGLLLCGSLGLLLFVLWQGYSGMLQALVFVLGIGVGMEALASSFFVACQVKGRQDLEGKIKTASAGLGFAYGFSLLFAGAAPLIVAFYKIIETLANLAGVMFATLKKAHFRLRRPDLGSIWQTGLGSTAFTLMAIATIVYNKANIFFLQRYAGSEGVAQYSVTWEMVDGISILASNLLLKNVLFPLFVNLWETDRGELAQLVRNSARWLLAAALPIMFVLFIESDRIISLVYGSGYGEAIWMQKYLVTTIAIAFLHNLAAYLMLSMKHEWLLLGFYVAGLIFNLFCCTLLIPSNPLFGSVLSIVLTKGAVAVATISFCHFRFGLISGKALLHLTATALAGGGLYFLAGSLLFREAAEALALLPILTLAWRWWREFSQTQKATAS